MKANNQNAKTGFTFKRTLICIHEKEVFSNFLIRWNLQGYPMPTNHQDCRIFPK